MPYDVFLSYRRGGSAAEARAIHAELGKRGVRAFLDVEELRAGNFDEALLRHIAETPNFVLLLCPNALDRCADPEDWLRREIVQAVRSRAVIIPVLFPGFSFPPPESLPEPLRSLPRRQSVEYNHTYFSAMVDRLTEYLAPGTKEEAAGTPTRRQRTALSLDVVGSSRMKQPGLTMAVQNRFNQFRDFVRQRLQAHDSLAYNWAGDGLLALFARPSQATACAAAVMDGLAEFNARGGQAAPIRVRMGVHTGAILLAAGQPLGEVMSRTIDLAVHLQKRCGENSALISDEVYAALPDNARWTPHSLPGETRFSGPVYRLAVPVACPVTTGAITAGLRIEVVTGAQRAEHIVAGELVIGRQSAEPGQAPVLVLRGDTAVSRRHARIFSGKEGFHLEDLGSVNGTTFDGRALRAPTRLQPGDVIEIGEQTVIRVKASG